MPTFLDFPLEVREEHIQNACPSKVSQSYINCAETQPTCSGYQKISTTNEDGSCCGVRTCVCKDVIDDC